MSAPESSAVRTPAILFSSCYFSFIPEILLQYLFRHALSQNARKNPARRAFFDLQENLTKFPVNRKILLFRILFPESRCGSESLHYFLIAINTIPYFPVFMQPSAQKEKAACSPCRSMQGKTDGPLLLTVMLFPVFQSSHPCHLL